MSNKSRNLYIDIMKGLLIILVVIGHLPYFDYDSRTLTLIYSFHMHSFLIIGGLLSHVDDSTKFWKTIIRRISGTLIPYFIFYIISFLIVKTRDFEHLKKAIFVVFRGIGDPVNAINLPLWFLTFYFVTMTVFECIEILSHKIKNLIFKNSLYLKRGFVFFLDLIFVAIIMYLSFYYGRIYKGARLPFNAEIAGFCLGFVYFGKLLGYYIPLTLSEIKKSTLLKVLFTIICILITLTFTLIWYVFSMRNGRIDLNARDYKNALYMYIDAIIGFVLFSFFSYIVTKLPLINKIIGSIGENSIYILAYHVPSTIITYGYVLPILPAVVGTKLSSNSLYSVMLLTSFGIFWSLIMALIHKSLSFRR